MAQIQVPYVNYTRGVKGKVKDKEGKPLRVTFKAIGEVKSETVTKRGSKTDENPEGVQETTSYLQEDGIITDPNVAGQLLTGLFPNDKAAGNQAVADALVRHHNKIMYDRAVAPFVAEDKPDELDDIIGDLMTGDAKATFKRTVTSLANMTGKSRLQQGLEILEQIRTKKTA